MSMKKTAELLGLEKEVQRVNKDSANWDEILEKLRNETKMLRAEQKSLQEKIKKMGNKEMILKKANDSTEKEIEGLEAQIGNFRNFTYFFLYFQNNSASILKFYFFRFWFLPQI